MSKYFDNKDLFLEPTTTQHGSHMVMTNVNKAAKIKYVNIDTRFRDDNDYTISSNYNITLPERITDVKSISITNIEIPNVYFNISKSLGNNSFTITKVSNSVSQNIIIPDGNYTSTTLTTQINSLLLAASYDITYSISYYKSVFTSTSNTYTLSFAIDNDGNFDRFNFKRKFGWILGFRTPTYKLTAGSSITSDSFLDLNGLRYMYLAIDEFSRGNQSSFVSPLPKSLINKNIIARISTDGVNHGFGTIHIANRRIGTLLSDCRSYTGKIDLLKLNVQLLDEYGNNISLYGADFSFCMEVEYE